MTFLTDYERAGYEGAERCPACGWFLVERASGGLACEVCGKPKRRRLARRRHKRRPGVAGC